VSSEALKEMLDNEGRICPPLLLNEIWMTGPLLKLLRVEGLNLAPIYYLIMRIQPRASCHWEYTHCFQKAVIKPLKTKSLAKESLL